LKYLDLTTLFLIIVFFVSPSYAQTFESENLITTYDRFINDEDNTIWNSYLNGKILFTQEFSSIVEYSSDEDTVSIYNTGVKLKAKHKKGLSISTTATVDGKVGEIDSEDFKLGRFIKELKLGYEFDINSTAILLSVGKMPTGTKTDVNSPQDLGGVMGVRLTISPSKIPLIQDWLDQYGLKITKIEITRYDATSGADLNFEDLHNTDMTAYALYILYKKNLQLFFIYKHPDSDSMSPTGVTVGGVYTLNAPMRPMLFALNHHSSSSYMELNVLVLSASVEIFDKTRVAVTWSLANETLSNKKTMSSGVELKRDLGDIMGMDMEGVLGTKHEEHEDRDSEDEEDIYYLQLRVKF